MLHDSTLAAPVCKTFLQRLMTGVTNPVFVVIDGHPVHKSALVRQCIESQAGKSSNCFSYHRTRPSSTRRSRFGHMSNGASAANSSNPRMK